MAAITYSGPISTIPTNKYFLEEKRTCAKFQIDISKTVPQYIIKCSWECSEPIMLICNVTYFKSLVLGIALAASKIDIVLNRLYIQHIAIIPNREHLILSEIH